MADIPAGTGLGSSGAFTVGVLRALLAHSHQIRPNEELAELACEIEIERLKAPVGRQDQYIAATGGVTAFEFLPDDTVNVIPVEMTGEARAGLEENLVLFYTGVSRSAASELANQTGLNKSSSPTDLTDNLNAVKALGLASFEALGVGDLTGFADLLTQQWKLKLQRSPTELHEQIDGWIERGLTAGASGGKLVGAGGGGFVLFYAESKADLRAEMLDLGLDEVRFAFDYEGSTTIVSR
jgi:D-glycero-alpha-D-manno-heptose-7-phosphate kinase